MLLSLVLTALSDAEATSLRLEMLQGAFAFMSAVSRVLQSADDRISKRNFEKLSEYIYNYSGIKMPAAKITMLEGRLRRRLRATGHSSFDDYCHFLFQQSGLESEAVYLIDAVTTNKTDFFREPNHFSFMTNQALPELVGNGVYDIRAWSAACSTGAEPYTMAMVMDDFIDGRSGLGYGIVATDLSTEVLDVARRGIYTADMVVPVPTPLRNRYVMPALDATRREVRIAPGLRARVGFGRMNLMDPAYPIRSKMHLIFCRNVLIYFDKKTQTGVLQRLCDCLEKGGFLFIGHSESITGIDLPLRQVGNTVFQRL